MKILIVHNSYQQPGGEDTVFRQEQDLLRRHGHEVITYEKSNFEVDGFTGIKKLALIKDVMWNGTTRQELSEMLRRERPDVVHVHNTFMRISPSIYSACSEAGIPVVQTLHNYRLLCPATNFFREGHACEECLEHGTWRGIAHACYHESSAATATVAAMQALHRTLGTWDKHVHTFVALSNFSRQKFVEGGMPAEKITVKPNFVDPDPGPRSADGDYGVFVGRMSEEKGLETLLAGFALTPKMRLIIVGDGPPMEALKKFAAGRSMTNVEFRGRLARQETWTVVKGARFLIQPSECYENFPMSVAEAFACGTPVLCSRIGALQEIVRENVTGLQFTAGDSQDLAAKVLWASENRVAMARMGKQARAEFESKYTAEKNYVMLMELYQRATGSSVVEADLAAVGN